MVNQRLPSTARQAFDKERKSDMLAYALIIIGVILELKIGLTTSDPSTMLAIVGLVGLQMLWPLHHFFPRFVETCLRVKREARDPDDHYEV